MSETQSDAQQKPARQSEVREGQQGRERKGVENWIKLRGKWEEIVNKTKGRKEEKEREREGEGRKEGGKGRGKEDRGEQGKGGKDQDKVTRYHPPWPQEPSNFITSPDINQITLT